MTSRVVNLLLISCLTFFAGCGDPKKSPADAVNAFLRAVHRQDCKEVFSFFSSASQEKVREEVARAAKDYPHLRERLHSGEFLLHVRLCKSLFNSHARLRKK